MAKLSRFMWLDAMIEKDGWKKTDFRDQQIYAQYEPNCADWKRARELCKVQELIVDSQNSVFLIVMTPDKRERFVRRKDIRFCPNGIAYARRKKGSVCNKIITGGADRVSITMIDGQVWSDRFLGTLGDKGLTNLILTEMKYKIVKDKSGKEFVEAEVEEFDRNGNLRGIRKELSPKPPLYIATPSKKGEPDSLLPFSMFSGEF